MCFFFVCVFGLACFSCLTMWICEVWLKHVVQYVFGSALCIVDSISLAQLTGVATLWQTVDCVLCTPTHHIGL
jgi:hypothetical protein